MHVCKQFKILLCYIAVDIGIDLKLQNFMVKFTNAVDLATLGCFLDAFDRQ